MPDWLAWEVAGFLEKCARLCAVAIGVYGPFLVGVLPIIAAFMARTEAVAAVCMVKRLCSFSGV